MIYLYTGSNGSGKTLNSIKFICEQLNPDGERPVYYYSPASKPIGIQEAGVLDWTPLNKEQVFDWWDYPEGSIFLVDEFRTVWPYRTHKETIPKSVDLLSDHRDRGFDFILTAQKCTAQFDPAIQGFIEEHRHLEGVGGSAKSRHFVYQSYCSSPLNPGKLQAVDQETVSFDKKYYDYYRSASLHTHKNRLPYKKMLMLLPLVLLIPVLFYLAFSAISPDEESVPVMAQSSSFLSGDNRSTFSGGDPEDYSYLHTPRIEGLPHTAPIYDELMEPQQAPKLAACILFHESDTCKCHTQQATPLDVSDSICRSVVKNGWFDPSIEPPSKRRHNKYSDSGLAVSGKALASAQPALPRSRPRLTHLADTSTRTLSPPRNNLTSSDAAHVGYKPKSPIF